MRDNLGNRPAGSNIFERWMDLVGEKLGSQMNLSFYRVAYSLWLIDRKYHGWLAFIPWTVL